MYVMEGLHPMMKTHDSLTRDADVDGDLFGIRRRLHYRLVGSSHLNHKAQNMDRYKYV